jgi:hypothetical protein
MKNIALNLAKSVRKINKTLNYWKVEIIKNVLKAIYKSIKHEMKIKLKNNYQ